VVLSCAAVLLDLDGVLVDSTRAVQAVWHAWAERHGVPYAQLRARMHGRRTVDLVAELAPQLDAAGEGAAIDGRQARAAAELDRALPGADALLRALPSGRWAVVTSGPRLLADARLRAAGLPLPAAMVCGDDVAEGKPSPRPYLLGAERLGVAPAACVGIEDARRRADDHARGGGAAGGRRPARRARRAGGEARRRATGAARRRVWLGVERAAGMRPGGGSAADVAPDPPRSATGRPASARRARTGRPCA
jgi:mannitol-1-/sugar-/sorbitol-6-phosphatase